VTGTQLLIYCLEREGVRYVFGVPGEETLDLNDALLDSPVRFDPVRHEQGAAFMADVDHPRRPVDYVENDRLTEL
jgi:acetolactate synthase-1/2/3 large subunit